MPREQGRKLIAQNRKARHDYSIEGRATLTDGFATIDDGEAWLRGVHIPEYDLGTWNNHEPRRTRKLLLKRDELRKIAGKLKESGLTLVPLALYFKDGYAKVEIGIGKGRKAHDKRQAIAERESNREIQKASGRRSKGMT